MEETLHAGIARECILPRNKSHSVQPLIRPLNDRNQYTREHHTTQTQEWLSHTNRTPLWGTNRSGEIPTFRKHRPEIGEVLPKSGNCRTKQRGGRHNIGEVTRRVRPRDEGERGDLENETRSEWHLVRKRCKRAITKIERTITRDDGHETQVTNTYNVLYNMETNGQFGVDCSTMEGEHEVLKRKLEELRGANTDGQEREAESRQ